MPDRYTLDAIAPNATESRTFAHPNETDIINYPSFDLSFAPAERHPRHNWNIADWQCFSGYLVTQELPVENLPLAFNYESGSTHTQTQVSGTLSIRI